MACQCLTWHVIVLGMAYQGKKRHVASQAVIDLRKALALTQQAFAVKLKSAITTVARWETTHPPHGQTLIRLAEEAQKARKASRGQDGERTPETQKLIDLMDTFKRLYLDEVFANLGGMEKILLRFHATKADPEPSVYFLAKLRGTDEIRAGYGLAGMSPALFDHHERLYGRKSEGKD